MLAVEEEIDTGNELGVGLRLAYTVHMEEFVDTWVGSMQASVVVVLVVVVVVASVAHFGDLLDVEVVTVVVGGSSELDTEVVQEVVVFGSSQLDIVAYSTVLVVIVAVQAVVVVVAVEAYSLYSHLCVTLDSAFFTSYRIF